MIICFISWFYIYIYIFQQIDTFYRKASPPSDVQSSGQSILLLHGMAFKSETWLNLNTINILAAMGHEVIAVDLPGMIRVLILIVYNCINICCFQDLVKLKDHWKAAKNTS